MSGRRILLVDDDEDICQIARMSLELIGGHEVLALSSGKEALAAACEFAPDLMLLDVSMPEMDGPQTLVALRQLPGLSEVPAVFLTARTQGKDVMHYRALGASDVIAKPFIPEHLCNRVDAVFAAAQPPTAPVESPRTALIVEDDPDIRYLLGFILEQQGYRMIAAHDGSEGLHAISEGQLTDIVILDIMLPGTDGLALLDRLRATDRWKAVPVIMLTSKGDEQTVTRALSAGASDYLVKPFDPADLVDRIERLQSRRSTVS